MVEIRFWRETDRPLLELLLADPNMTHYVGGPESAEQIQSRHERYLRLTKSNTYKAPHICRSSK